jgi:hypothetical protein
MTNLPPDHSESASSAYRAYLIGQSGKVEGSVTIFADNDDDATQQARSLAYRFEIELWDRSRVVIRLPPKDGR